LGLMENASRQEGPGNKVKIIAFLILLFIIIGTAGVAYLISQDVDLKSVSLKDLLDRNILSRDTKYELQSTDFEYDASTVFRTYKGYIVKCSRDSLIYLDSNGNEQWSFQLSLKNPVLRSAGSYLLLADYGSKRIMVFNGKELAWEKELDNNIINADINAKGYVSVVHGEERSRGAVSVFNRQGIKCFTMGKAENFVMSSEVSPSGKNVFINSVDTSGISTNSVLEFADIHGNILEDKVEKENAILSSVNYMGNDDIFAVGDSMFMMLDKSLKEKFKQDVNGKIFSSCIADGKYAVVAANPEEATGIFESGSADIWIFDGNGERVSEYNIKGEVKNLASFQDLIAVNSGNKFRIIDLDARLLAEYSPKVDIREAYFINRREVLAIYDNKFSVLRMK
jgi:hypothetical protein